MDGVPGGSYYGEFVTTSATGAAVNADSLPTATANHNGADDSGFVLTVTNIDTGRYKVTGTIPSTYIFGDYVWISVNATIATIAAKSIIDKFVVDSPIYIRSGICQSGSTSSTIKLALTENSTTDNIFRDQTVFIWDGLGVGQTALINSYTASSRIALITPNWLITPDGTSKYVIFPTSKLNLASTGLATIKESSGTYDLRQVITMMWEMLMAGKISNLPTSPATIRDFADTQDRVHIAFDSNNNRTSITVNNAP